MGHSVCALQVPVGSPFPSRVCRSLGSESKCTGWICFFAPRWEGIAKVKVAERKKPNAKMAINDRIESLIAMSVGATHRTKNRNALALGVAYSAVVALSQIRSAQ
jgi:hypothetical protein